MPSIWSAFSSSTKSPPLKGKSKSSIDISRNLGTDDHKKKLTRQRKLRHVTDDEMGLKKSQSLPVSPGSDSGAQTPHRVVAGHWSKSALPQPLPLPLPEVNSQLHNPNESFRDFPITRTPSNQNFGKTKPNLTGRSYIAPTYHCKGFPKKLDIDTAKNDFRLHIPTKSAPSTGYSSPVLSPQRYRTIDLFHPSYQVLSDFKAITLDRLSTSTPDQSPLNSLALRTPPVNGNTTTCNRGCLNKSLQENWPDNCNDNVHPLPRPPIVSRPSPRTRHSIDRSDGSLVKGMWQKGKPIGRGTYGSVYVATHRETGATCAVKEVEIIPDDPKCAECIKQLEQPWVKWSFHAFRVLCHFLNKKFEEMKFLRELKHPNIVEYYGCEVIEDRFCIYLEYVHPGSINKYVHEHCGALTESIVRNFTRHILSGLAYLHSTKTIHRDIKGANLLVNASGVVKLADFGLAKHLAGQDISLSLKGTPHWMSPEVLQAFMRKDANPEVAYGVDIWSVGCTVIEMMTGKPPWSEYNGVQAMFNILNKELPIPESLSAEGKDFLQRCFQRRPEDRPSASKLLEHPFLRSSSDQNFGGSPHEVTGAKLHNVQSWPARNTNVMPLSSITRIQDRVQSLNRETNWQPCQDSVDLGVTTTHHSPRSILEDLHSTSLPDLNRYLNSSSPSNVQKNVFSKASNSNIYKGISHFEK